MNENRILTTASDDEIRAIIVKVATAKGHFLLRDVETALLEAGIQPKSVNWKSILDETFQRDSFLPHNPYSASMEVNPPRPANPLDGMPNLSQTGGNIINAMYRKIKGKHGGVSQQAPNNLGIKPK